MKLETTEMASARALIMALAAAQADTPIAIKISQSLVLDAAGVVTNVRRAIKVKTKASAPVPAEVTVKSKDSRTTVTLIQGEASELLERFL